MVEWVIIAVVAVHGRDDTLGMRNWCHVKRDPINCCRKSQDSTESSLIGGALLTASI
jgi:hypothetical protein